MSAFTTPRKSLRLRKNEPSPFLSNRKRELFPVDNWDEDSHDIIPLNSSPLYDSGLASPQTPLNKNHTPITELSPTMSDKFKKLMSDTKNGNLCSATIVIEETPSSRIIKHFSTTPFESETNKEAKTPFKKNGGFNSKSDLGVRTKSFYGKNQISLEDLRVKRFTRLHSNPKVKAKLFKDTKSTTKKRYRSSSQENKTKSDLFPGIILPFKKKSASTAKKLFIKTEVLGDENSTITENIVKQFNSDITKPSSTKKNTWTEYIKQEKPERIKIEHPENRKFFKSKIINSDTSTLNKKNNGFNFNVVNWGNENKMSANIKVEPLEFNNTEIVNDNENEKIEEEVNELIELLYDDEDNALDEQNNISTAIRYPGLVSKTIKRDYEKNDDDSCININTKRMKTDDQIYSRAQKCETPDLIKDTYENYAVNNSSSPKNESNEIQFNNIAAVESIDSSVVMNESPQTKLFPIFTIQTPSPKQIIREQSTVRKVKRFVDAAQYQIDAGQKKFGGYLCKQCGLYYSRGEPEDDAEHDKYHKAKEVFKYNSFKNEKVVYQDINERIVMISGSDPKTLCTKALELMTFVDQELGFSVQNDVLPTTKRVYLYIKNKLVIGCLVVEPISQAYRNLETETEDMVIISEESYHAKVGVNRIWTKWDCRGNGIATRLLDCFRKNYAYGYILTIDEIAFTVPTRAGNQFIKKYTNKSDYLVYTGW